MTTIIVLLLAITILAVLYIVKIGLTGEYNPHKVFNPGETKLNSGTYFIPPVDHTIEFLVPMNMFNLIEKGHLNNVLYGIHFLNIKYFKLVFKVNYNSIDFMLSVKDGKDYYTINLATISLNLDSNVKFVMKMVEHESHFDFTFKIARLDESDTTMLFILNSVIMSFDEEFNLMVPLTVPKLLRPFRFEYDAQIDAPLKKKFEIEILKYASE